MPTILGERIIVSDLSLLLHPSFPSGNFEIRYTLSAKLELRRFPWLHLLPLSFLLEHSLVLARLDTLRVNIPLPKFRLV